MENQTLGTIAATVGEGPAANPEQALLTNGPLNGVRVTIAPGQTRLQIAERMGPPRVNSRSMPPEIIVAAKVGEYVQGTEPGAFIWAGWGR